MPGELWRSCPENGADICWTPQWMRWLIFKGEFIYSRIAWKQAYRLPMELESGQDQDSMMSCSRCWNAQMGIHRWPQESVLTDLDCWLPPRSYRRERRKKNYNIFKHQKINFSEDNQAGPGSVLFAGWRCDVDWHKCHSGSPFNSQVKKKLEFFFAPFFSSHSLFIRPRSRFFFFLYMQHVHNKGKN